MSTRYYSTVQVPFERALADYKAAHAHYLAGRINDGSRRDADAKAFEALADARRREGRPWCSEDYR